MCIAGLSSNQPCTRITHLHRCPKLSQTRARSAARHCKVRCRAAVVGIDLGTSNSAVAVLEAGVPVVIPDETGCPTTPSVVAYTQAGEVLVGASARRQAQLNPRSTFSSVKRLIGRQFSEVQAEAQLCPYSICAGEGGAAVLDCPATSQTLLPEGVSAEIVRSLVGRAQRYLDDDIEGAVITVPAYFSEAQRRATLRAAELAGLPKAQLLQEPVAAAIANGLGQRAACDTVLVFDLGGGTFDVSILEAFDGILEVLATAGDARLGGDDYDRALASFLVEQHIAAGGSDFRHDPTARQRVLEAAEKLKVSLSTSDEAAATVQFIDGTTALEARISRRQFEAVSQQLQQRLIPPLESIGEELFVGWAERPAEALCPLSSPDSTRASETIGSANSRGGAGGKWAPSPRKITEVVLVGGATRMPAVQRLVHRITGIAPSTRVNPEQAVALGAAIQAGTLVGSISGVEIMDGAYSWDLHARTSGFAGFAPATS